MDWYELPIDVRVLICSNDQFLWRDIAIVDLELYNYTFYNEHHFIELFHKEVITNEYRSWEILDIVHTFDDRPAYIRSNGLKIWAKKGYIHRDNDLPAVIHPNGMKRWIKYREHHREFDQPAIIQQDGTKIWCYNGKVHRDLYDQPAIMYENGDCCWVINGEIKRKNNLPTFVSADGTISWRRFMVDSNEMMLHRDDDLPALIYSNGTKVWYQNNKIHRDGNKPAIVKPCGITKYYRHGVQYQYNVLTATMYNLGIW